jgi:hypothetical protein
MNTTLRDVFTQRANEVGPADLDVGELIDLGERRLRRRRIIATVGSAAAVVLAIALALGGAALNRSADHGPTDKPKTTDHTAPPDAPQARPRKIVYGDEDFGTGASIKYGNGVVESGNAYVHMDVVDGGFVYTTEEGRLWYSDGGRPESIASHVCGRSWSVVPQSNFIGAYEQNAVMAANAGSLVAWFECSREQPTGTLVSFDTELGREVGRQPIAACARDKHAFCELTGVVGDHVYISVSTKNSASGDERLVRFDSSSGREQDVSANSYAADIRSHPRGLVFGSTWRTGTATRGLGEGFDVIGSRLVPGRSQQVFDTATGRSVQFLLPAGYHPDPTNGYVFPDGPADPSTGFQIFEWIDDDTVALVQGGGWSTGDIITCQLSDGRCRLAVKAAPHHQVRIVPGEVLPG